MPTVADVIRRAGPAYVRRFGRAVPARHRTTLGALAACRTGRLGTVVFACRRCERRHHIGRSCGNRHCPTCQQDRGKSWFERHADQLLPCPYFLITFTVPAELRPVLRAHQRTAYDALFRASSEALRTLARDPKFVGTPTPGFLGVLHTWGRTLTYHPHLHYLVPGGGPNDDGTSWLSSRADFFVPVKALSKLFRAKFRAALTDAGLTDRVDPAVWRKDWVVHSKPVGDGRAALRYLAAYVFRVAITDRRIRAVDDDHVTFTWRKSGSRRDRATTVETHEFLRRLLQHVLPRGFQKVRYFGCLSPNSRHSPEKLRWLATLDAGETFVLDAVSPRSTTKPSLRRCADCGGGLCVLRVLRFAGRATFDSS